MRHLMILAAALSALSLSWATGCVEIRLPNKEAMVDVFTSRSETLIEEPPPPDSVPILATADVRLARPCDRAASASATRIRCRVGPPRVLCRRQVLRRRHALTPDPHPRG
jgi:hypothetical protein